MKNCSRRKCVKCRMRKRCGISSTMKVHISADGNTVNLGWSNPVVEELVPKIGKEIHPSIPLATRKGSKKKFPVYCG